MKIPNTGFQIRIQLILMHAETSRCAEGKGEAVTREDAMKLALKNTGAVKNDDAEKNCFDVLKRLSYQKFPFTTPGLEKLGIVVDDCSENEVELSLLELD